MNEVGRCGFVSFIGLPNVGKSTLLNAILGKKLSITSSKAQTTRHRLLGIKTENDSQIVFIDTPGLCESEKALLNRAMNRVARDSLVDVDLVLFVVAALRWREQEERILGLLKEAKRPVVLVINKIDCVKEMAELLPFIEDLNKKFTFVATVPVSAKKHMQIDDLETTILKNLPKQPFMFNEEDVTDRSHSFIASELLREQLMRHMGQELPYEAAVSIESFKDEEKILRISTIIWVERDSQKAMILGKNGQHMKTMATKARLSMQDYFEKKVFLSVWVKVKKGWSKSVDSLSDLGYGQ